MLFFLIFFLGPYLSFLLILTSFHPYFTCQKLVPNCGSM
jgi:hypothetical protein